MAKINATKKSSTTRKASVTPATKSTPLAVISKFDVKTMLNRKPSGFANKSTFVKLSPELKKTFVALPVDDFTMTKEMLASYVSNAEVEDIGIDKDTLGHIAVMDCTQSKNKAGLQVITAYLRKAKNEVDNCRCLEFTGTVLPEVGFKSRLQLSLPVGTQVSMRHYSNIIAALLTSQLRGQPAHLPQLTNSKGEFSAFVDFDGSPYGSTKLISNGVEVPFVSLDQVKGRRVRVAIDVKGLQWVVPRDYDPTNPADVRMYGNFKIAVTSIEILVKKSPSSLAAEALGVFSDETMSDSDDEDVEDPEDDDME